MILSGYYPLGTDIAACTTACTLHKSLQFASRKHNGDVISIIAQIKPLLCLEEEVEVGREEEEEEEEVSHRVLSNAD